jgi:microcystin-dependent protein
MSRIVGAGGAGRTPPVGSADGQVLTWDDPPGQWSPATPSGGPGGEAFPVGSVFIAVVSTNPATLLGYGTWSAFAAGRVLVGRDSGDSDFDTAEETGGEKTHTLTTAEMPSHTHVQDAHNHTQDAHTHTQNAHSHVQSLPTSQTGSQASGTRDTSTTGSTADALSTASATAVNQNATATNQAATATNQNAGGGGAHNNLQPYVVVYMWKRTA